MDIGLALSAVEYAIQIAHKVRDTARSLHHNPNDYNSLLSRFRSIRKTLRYIRVTGNIDLDSPVWGSAFRRIRAHFKEAAYELEEIHQELKANAWVRIFTTQNTSERLRALEDDVDQLQRDLDMLGFFTLSNAASEVHSKYALQNLESIQNSLAVMEHRLNAMSTNNGQSPHSKHDPKKKSSHHHSGDKSRGFEEGEIEPNSNNSSPFLSPSNSMLSNIETPNSYMDEEATASKSLVRQVHELETSLQSSFSKILQSNMSDDDKDLVCDRMLAVWKQWRINPADVVVTGPLKATEEDCIDNRSAPVIYCGKLSVRDHGDRVVRVANIVVRLLFTDLNGEEALDRLVRKVLLRRELNHPCTVYCYGGYWKTKSTSGKITSEREPQEKVGSIDSSCSFVVFERMTHNLQEAIECAALESKESRIRLLRDVSRGGEHVHSKGVFNFNLQPKNVWLRIIQGTIAGAVKIGNLEPACEAMIMNNTNDPQDSEESSKDLSRNGNHAVDVWHFGVLACLLLSKAKTEDESMNLKNVRISVDNETILKFLPTLIEGIEESQLRALITACTSSDAESRPSFTEICNELHVHLNNGSKDPSVLEDGRKFRVQAKDYFYGRNGKKADLKQAVNLYRKAGECGDAVALVNLGDCHYYGLGVLKNASKAIELYHEAVNQENSTGLVRLGDCYQRGTGVENDMNFAINLYRRAAAYGNASGQYKLGCYLLNEDDGGLGSPEEAASLFEKAAAAGHRFAEFYLGLCFEEGRGVRKDLERALSWYGKSAAHGHIGAQWALERHNQIQIFFQDSSTKRTS